MKILLIVSLLVVATLLASHVTSGPELDPVLLRRGQSAARARRDIVSAKRYITLIDYRRSILQTRLWVFDQKTQKVVLSSRVSHAWKTGLFYANSFSNTNGSEKSCLGAFVTGSSYKGRFGYSLRLKGLDSSNSNTLSRAVIVHNSPYFIPFSLGCFTTNVNKELIDLIQGGSFLFVSK